MITEKIGRKSCSKFCVSKSSPAKSDAFISHRPLVLDSMQWSRIIKHLRPNEELEMQSQKDLEYETYLKNGSRAMTKNWENTIEKNRARKNAERKRIEEEKKAEVERCFRELEENDKRDRKERIAYAENLLKCLKSGPQQLESAYKLSQILHEQELQRQAKRERERCEREKNLIEGRRLIEQADQWIEDQKEQIKQYIGRCADYKKILQNDIAEKEKQRRQLVKMLLELEKVEREANGQQMQQQIEKEHKAIAQRKQKLRQNADDAFQWIQERHQSETQKAINEQKCIDEYLAQNSQQQLQNKVQEKINRKQRAEFCHKLALKLFSSLPDVEGAENALYQRAVKEFAKNWMEQEQKKKEHIQKLKEDRIKWHHEEMKNLEKIKQEQMEHDQKEKLNRMHNEKVDVIFDLQHRLSKIERTKQLKHLIREQMEQQAKAAHDEKVKDRIDTNRAIDNEIRRDDEEFFNYANRLINDARAKGKPLYPLIKAVQQYKAQHSIDRDRGDLPHMKSHLDVGISVERKMKQCRSMKK